jgi:hypothetical protein
MENMAENTQKNYVILRPVLDARRPSTIILQITWPGVFKDNNKSSN